MKTKHALPLLLSLMLLAHLQAFSKATPTMVSPSNGSTTWVSPTLDWNVVVCQQYQVQFDTSSNFNSPLLQDIKKNYINTVSSNPDTQHGCGNLLFGTTYYWRVRCYSTGDTSAWSSSWSFTTRDYITITGPADGSSTWANTTVEWAPHVGVSHYMAEADTSPNFNSPAKISTSKAYINSTDGNSDTYFTMDDLYFNKTYYWRVRGRNAVDTSAWSTSRTIIIRDYVTISSPANGTSTWAGTTLEWLPHNGVSYY